MPRRVSAWGVSAGEVSAGGVSAQWGGCAQGDVCWGVCPGGCLPGGVHPLVDRMTGACENITFPQLLLRTVIIYKRLYCYA